MTSKQVEVTISLKLYLQKPVGLLVYQFVRWSRLGQRLGDIVPFLSVYGQYGFQVALPIMGLLGNN